MQSTKHNLPYIYLFSEYLGIHHNKPPQTTTTVDAPVNNQPLTKNSGMPAIINRLRKPDSGLEVKDRTWLKLQIPHAFIGSELVQWLCTNVEGFEVIFFSISLKNCLILQFFTPKNTCN